MTTLGCKDSYALAFGPTDIESLIREFWASSGVTSAVQEKNFDPTDMESLIREFWASSGVTSAVQEKNFRQVPYLDVLPSVFFGSCSKSFCWNSTPRN